MPPVSRSTNRPSGVLAQRFACARSCRAVRCLRARRWGDVGTSAIHIVSIYRHKDNVPLGAPKLVPNPATSHGRGWPARRLPGHLGCLASGTLSPMSFGPSALRGFQVSGTGGRVEYRLARNAVVREFRKGRLSRLEVCDAHPELLRAARNVGVPFAESCPICEETSVVHVTYVFGPRLPAHGRCVSSPQELARLCGRADEVACYVVEVCSGCAWNHLARMYPAGGRHRRAAGHAANGSGQIRGATSPARQHGRTRRLR
jgi:hypothetical protein